MSALIKRTQQKKQRQRRQRLNEIAPAVKLHDGAQPMVYNGGSRPKTFGRGTTILVKVQGGGYRPV